MGIVLTKLQPLGFTSWGLPCHPGCTRHATSSSQITWSLMPPEGTTPWEGLRFSRHQLRLVVFIHLHIRSIINVCNIYIYIVHPVIIEENNEFPA